NGVAATATLAAAFAVAVPVSIVYSVTAANVGTQFSGRRGVVRLRFLLPIVATALLAIPVPALLGAGFAWILLVAGVCHARPEAAVTVRSRRPALPPRPSRLPGTIPASRDRPGTTDAAHPWGCAASVVQAS